MQIQLPDGNIGEVPDDMPHDQILETVNKQFPQGYKSEPPKKVAGLMDKLDMITTGFHRGVSHYTFALMGKLPFGEKYREAVKRADTKVQSEQDYNKKTYQGYYPQVSELAGEMAITAAPAAKAFKAARAATGAIGASGLLSTGLFGKAMSYAPGFVRSAAAPAVEGAATMAAIESQRFNPENPGEMFNTERVKEVLTNPLSYALPAAMDKVVGGWTQQANRLIDAKKISENAMARHVRDPGLKRKISGLAFDSIPNLTGFGKGVKLMKGIGDDIYNYINKLSGGLSAKYSSEYKKIAGHEFNKSLQRIKQTQNDLWDKPFKKVAVKNLDDVHSIIDEAKSILQTKDVPLSERNLRLINRELSPKKILDAQGNPIKQGLKVEDVKNIASIIGDSAGDAFKLGGSTATKIGVSLSELRNNLIDASKRNLSGKDLVDYTTASTASSNYYKTLEMSSKIKKALYNEVDARNVVKSIMSEAEALDKQKALGLMSDTGRKATYSAKLAGELENAGANSPNGVDLNAFINNTGKHTVIPDLMGDTYKSIEGLNKYLNAVHESSQHRLPAKIAGLGVLSTGAGVGTGTIGSAPIAAAMVTYNTLASIANRSPLKSALGYLTKDLSSSARTHMMKKVQDLLTRGGFLVSTDGVLKHKEEDSE